MANVATTKPGFPAKVVKFFKETWVELKKTSWPSGNELYKNTVLVIVALIIVTTFIGGLSGILSIVQGKLPK